MQCRVSRNIDENTDRRSDVQERCLMYTSYSQNNMLHFTQRRERQGTKVPTLSFLCYLMYNLPPTSSTAMQKFISGVNVFCDGSPSRILIVLRISLGMTTLPRSSILLTIPVAFIILTPLFARFANIVFAVFSEICETHPGNICNFAALLCLCFLCIGAALQIRCCQTSF